LYSLGVLHPAPGSVVLCLDLAVFRPAPIPSLSLDSGLPPADSGSPPADFTSRRPDLLAAG
jgi:hypothetical protein